MERVASAEARGDDALGEERLEDLRGVGVVGGGLDALLARVARARHERGPPCDGRLDDPESSDPGGVGADRSETLARLWTLHREHAARTTDQHDIASAC